MALKQVRRFRFCEPAASGRWPAETQMIVRYGQTSPENPTFVAHQCQRRVNPDHRPRTTRKAWSGFTRSRQEFSPDRRSRLGSSRLDRMWQNRTAYRQLRGLLWWFPPFLPEPDDHLRPGAHLRSSHRGAPHDDASRRGIAFFAAPCLAASSSVTRLRRARRRWKWATAGGQFRLQSR
jgi:hypothetical protein